MEGASLKRRAVGFAVSGGAVAFVLALAATYDSHVDSTSIGRALIAAIVCAVMVWAAITRGVAERAAAIDHAIARLAQAGRGDFDSPIPLETKQYVPQLANAMSVLFTQTAANIESVHRLAMFDPVTGLANRTNFRRSCERILIAAPSGELHALFFIDLDRFKAVNDTMGHAMGDMLLGMVANRLRAVADRVTSEFDIPMPLIGRLAGDEFTMFFQKLPNRDEANRIASGILFALGEPFELLGTEVEIGASIGIALRPDHGTTLTDLMRAADAAMYHAKARGRARAEYFTDALAAALADRAQLETDLRVALEQNQFTLVFQPQVSCSEGRIVAAEALLRWRHPTLGLKLPGSFIQRAEETGLIVEIGEWVIATVADTIARWGRIGIEQRLAINISPRQLDHAQFFRRLRDAMLAAGAPARLLELEITETMAMHCSEDVVEAIAALRADGATIAIDDFGTGYSNLARLRDLPVDRVKLDRSLIEFIADRAQARVIAQAVIGLIHGLGCEAVAEGIETPAQADVLRVIGCDVIQGYEIAQPMDEESFLAWARSLPRQMIAG